jgi:cell shape-determining protein MreC
MLGFLGLSPLKIFGIVAILAMIAIGVFYVKHNENVKQRLLTENAQLQANIDTYKNAIETQNETINFLKEEQKKRTEEFLRAESSFATIREQNQELVDKLNEFEESINAAENPQAAEVIVNDISKNVNRCFELISGAPLTAEEKNAKNENEFNPECPWLYADLVRN